MFQDFQRYKILMYIYLTKISKIHTWPMKEYLTSLLLLVFMQFLQSLLINLDSLALFLKIERDIQNMENRLAHSAVSGLLNPGRLATV